MKFDELELRVNFNNCYEKISCNNLLFGGGVHQAFILNKVKLGLFRLSFVALLKGIPLTKVDCLTNFRETFGILKSKPHHPSRDLHI